MNINPATDDPVVERARAVAAAMGKSLDEAVRDHVEHLANQPSLQNELQTFEKSALGTPGRLKAWKFNREQANCRA
jgi:antitoxin component of RelBE/YafQ-DinJ toxin-antitoxin module